MASQDHEVERAVQKTDEEWRRELTPAQYEVLRRAGTERPGTGAYTYSKDDGMYRCGACAAPLFSSDAKFDSGSGWPSFTEPVADANVEMHEDRTFLMRRTEVLCRRCGSHLGHVFDDGPPEAGGLRYCINSVALEFDPDAAAGAPDRPQPASG
jgi:peptide-methionine (R)-S-oxide reductase